MSHPPSWRLRLRAVTFGLLAIFIVLGPAPRQLGKYRHEALRGWEMFTGFGREICAIEFRVRDEQGEETRVDRLEALGEGPWWATSQGTRRVTSIESAETQGRRICKALDVQDLRLYAQCASTTVGWRRKAKGEDNLCLPKARQLSPRVRP